MSNLTTKTGKNVFIAKCNNCNAPFTERKTRAEAQNDATNHMSNNGSHVASVKIKQKI